MMTSFERLFGQQPMKNVSSQLENGDHTEIDASDLLDANGSQMYQSMICVRHCIVTIGRQDVTTAVMII
jgi:hypothetical protein